MLFNRMPFAFPLMGGAGDVTPPTVTITSTESSPSAKNPIPLTFTLSEASTNFAAGDVTVGAGGSLANFAGSGTSYTADLVVTTALATITVDVAQGAFTDAAGNGNTAATQFSITSSLILLDLFTIADDNPITSPRTCAPGPGTLNATDPQGRLSIASGNLVMASSGAGSTGDTFVRSAAQIPYAIGQMVYASVPATGGRGAVELSATNFLTGARIEANTGYTSTGFATDLGTFSNNLWIARDGNNIYQGSGTSLWWVDRVVFTGATYLFMGPVTLANSISYGFVNVFQLGAPWSTNYGIATNRVASPGVNETTTQIANAIVEMTWTAVTGQTWNLYVRQSDGTHNWIVRGDQGGSTIKLIENDAGEVERGSAAQTWTNGTAYRVTVKMSGNTIKVFTAAPQNPIPKITYASATFNNTATGVQTDRAGTDLIAWPITIAGAALTEMNKFTNP